MRDEMQEAGLGIDYTPAGRVLIPDHDAPSPLSEKENFWAAAWIAFCIVAGCATLVLAVV